MNGMGETRLPLANLAPPWAVYLFTFALILQFSHFLEHLIQVYQRAVLNIDTLHSHGVLFFFDTELVHAAFNTGYGIALIVVFLAIGLHRRASRILVGTGIWALFVALIALESWHVVEHIVRVSQHLVSGCQPCRGIFGQVTDVVYLHTFYNASVTIGSFVLYFAGGFGRRLLQIL
jgi:hypothetical protein